MNYKILLFTIALIFSFSSCDNDDDAGTINPDGEPTILCDAPTIVDASYYNNVTQSSFSINEAIINGDCLELSISSGGCDGETWNVDLIDSGDIAESYPVQRFLRINMENLEVCNAYITKSYSFDLTPIQIDSYNQVILNLQDYNGSLLYEY